MTGMNHFASNVFPHHFVKFGQNNVQTAERQMLISVKFYEEKPKLLLFHRLVFSLLTQCC